MQPPASPVGEVVVGTCHFSTARALTRVATILAHHFDALPLAVRVHEKETAKELSEEERRDLFFPERDEAAILGYPIGTEILYDQRASALIKATNNHQAKALVLA